MVHPVKNIYKILLVIAALTTVLLSGCYTSKKADKELARVFSRFPEKMAKIARDSFPCILLKPDTSYLPGDTIVYIECPFFEDSTEKENSPIPIKPLPISVKIPVWNKIINHWFEDSAKIKLALKLAEDVKAKSNEQLKKANEAASKAAEISLIQKGKTTGWRLTAIILSLLLLLLMLAIIYILSKRSK